MRATDGRLDLRRPATARTLGPCSSGALRPANRLRVAQGPRHRPMSRLRPSRQRGVSLRGCVVSIYSTWLTLDDDQHADDCSAYVEAEPGVLDLSGKQCDCGQPLAPLVYQGSNCLPSDGDPRGGAVLVCGIPGHITHDGDWLRLSVYGAGKDQSAVVLTRLQVKKLHETLTAWLGAVS